MIALAFPIYLLWKGRLQAYLALMKSSVTATPLSGVGTIAPNAPTVYPGVPTTPFFYTPVNPAAPPAA